MRKIAIGSDHAGFPYKEPVINWLTANGFEVKDFGTYSENSILHTPWQVLWRAENTKKGFFYVAAARAFALPLTNIRVYAPLWYGIYHSLLWPVSITTPM
jgi:hypothetical protein